MDITQLQQGIIAKFAFGSANECRLLFWYDPEQSFQEVLSNLNIPDVTVLNMAGRSIFETKKRIELDEPRSRFLLYFPYAEPEPDKDWFLDIRLYSEQFYADASSLLLNELGISKMSLRGHIRSRQDFFANKQRTAALKRFITENEDERSLDRKMLAVLVKADSASLPDILLSLLKDYSLGLEEDDLPLMDAVIKFNLTDALWLSLVEEFAYEAKEPNLPDLALKLFCTELWSQIEGTERDWLLNNVLKTSSGRATALAFMASWRDSRSYAQYHDSISQLLGQKLEVANQCALYQPQQLVECVSFEAVEQALIRGLVRDLLDNAKSLDRSLFESILSRRLVGHWCLSRKEYTAIYEAMRNAELLLHLRQRFVDGFHYDSAKAMYDAYLTDIYQFDQAYRLFNEHVQALVNIGAEILRQLDESIENLYTHWYLYELGLAWDRLLEKEQRLTNWRLPGIASQYHFYQEAVKPRIAAKQTKRIFVIISDAFRYEIAQELAGILNGEKRLKAELSSQLGVLPSYTQLAYSNNGFTNPGKYIQSNHYVAGFEYLPSSTTRLTFEGFYKGYKNYPVSTLDKISLANKGIEFGAIGNEPIQQDGTGRAYGFEFFAQQKLTEKFFGVLSYTLYWSEFSGLDKKLKPASWDNRHLISTTVGYKLPKNWELGVKFRYQGAAPYTPFNLEQSRLNFLTLGSGVFDYDQVNTLRLKAFHSGDIRLDKKWNYKKTTFDFYIDIQNFYASKSTGSPQYTFKRTDDNARFVSTNGKPVQTNGSNAIPFLLENAEGTLIPTIGFIIEF